jgi:hypothetical protein
MKRLLGPLLFCWILGTSEGAAQLLFPSWSNPPAQPIRGVVHQAFHSNGLNTDVGFNVLLPPDYGTQSRRSPVLYWLHGRGGHESNGGIAFIAPAALAAMETGAIPPFIIVFVNGGRATFYADSPDGSIPVETMLTRE